VVLIRGGEMIFKDREEAALLLGRKLARYRGQNPLILAIPRGAVPMGRVITDALEGELDVILVHKLGAPGQTELAIGAVDEAGNVYLSEHARTLGIDSDYIAREQESQLAMLRKRRIAYTPVHAPIEPSGRVVIVVDDGIATGATMVTAIRAVRLKNPSRLIAATAVASREALQMIRGIADDVICLEEPESFYAVGQFFREFPQVTDEEVIEIFKKSRSQTGRVRR
jgi:putative phosphoribosyl transferase